jgi:uncharacterized protein
MTPQERQLVDELFDRLTTLENAPRDPEAERAIADGLRSAPHAPYALVQTALVQDEALKRADARIRELEAQLGINPEPQRQGGFLDSMRDTIFGRREEPRGSVPSVGSGDRPMGAPPGFGTGTAGQPGGPWAGSQPGAPPQGYGAPPPQGSPGGSFLGTAAAVAAGAVGGALLLGSIRSMFGGQSAYGAQDPYASPGKVGEMPWGGSNPGSGDLARQAGVDDIGRSGLGPSRSLEPGNERTGLFDSNDDDVGGDDVDYDSDGGSDT